MDSAPRRRLDLRGHGLTRVPEWVWSQPNLETLNLSENRIASVPDDIANLRSLRMLDLGHNALDWLGVIDTRATALSYL